MGVSGVLVIDKPAGMSSHDVVARVRRKLGLRKVGHAGTLDPDATGVLVLCVGDATRVLEYLGADEKVYVGEVTFGKATDTDDASGRVIAEASASGLTLVEVQKVARAFVGQVSQRVPAYSAVHINGQRAYELARAGEEVELPVRVVNVTEMEVLAFAPGEVAKGSFRVACSKGTYIRALCRDWGEQLNVPAHMSALRRTKSGLFGIESAVPLDSWLDSDDPASALLPTAAAVRGLPSIQLTDQQIQQLAYGQSIVYHPVIHDGTVAVFANNGSLAVVAEAVPLSGHVRLKPKKVLWKGQDGKHGSDPR